MLQPTTEILVEGANASLTAGHPGRAIDDLDSAIDLQPELASLWRSRALARLQAGDRKGAVADLGQAIDREPNDFLAWASLSEVAEQSGDPAAALAAWKHLLTIDPHAAEATRRLDMLQRKVLGNRA